jgi:hypothetical protein
MASNCPQNEIFTANGHRAAVAIQKNGGKGRAIKANDLPFERPSANSMRVISSFTRCASSKPQGLQSDRFSWLSHSPRSMAARRCSSGP